MGGVRVMICGVCNITFLFAVHIRCDGCVRVCVFDWCVGNQL